jgi:hypothetical protein
VVAFSSGVRGSFCVREGTHRQTHSNTYAVFGFVNRRFFGSNADSSRPARPSAVESHRTNSKKRHFEVTTFVTRGDSATGFD